jgi:hypothetical protein
LQKLKAEMLKTEMQPLATDYGLRTTDYGPHTARAERHRPALEFQLFSLFEKSVLQYLDIGVRGRGPHCSGAGAHGGTSLRWVFELGEHGCLSTSDERVRFIGPLDRSYPSACDARQGGDLVFSIDVTNHTVELNIVVPPGGGIACPRIYAPVYALAVEFGPLPAGEWVFRAFAKSNFRSAEHCSARSNAPRSGFSEITFVNQSSSVSYAFTNSFHVYPGVPAPKLAVESEMGQIRLRWPAVFYLHYEIESSSSLTNWQSVGDASTLDGTNRTMFLPAATNHQFFRVRRSPILQTLAFFPTDCGA